MQSRIIPPAKEQLTVSSSSAAAAALTAAAALGWRALQQHETLVCSDSHGVDTCHVVSCHRSLVTVILGALMMFLTSWKLALLTCATLPFMLLQFRTFARKPPCRSCNC